MVIISLDKIGSVHAHVMIGKEHNAQLQALKVNAQYLAICHNLNNNGDPQTRVVSQLQVCCFVLLVHVACFQVHKLYLRY
jgi:hypothetical protein